MSNSLDPVPESTKREEVVPTREQLRSGFLVQMSNLDVLNNQAITAGYTNVGWWLGPDAQDSKPSDSYQPVFILRNPVVCLVPHSWGVGDEVQEAFFLVHKYVFVSPDGPMAVCFKKRLVDANGQTSEYHSGPGGFTGDYDDIEGGEKGTFLRLLQTGRRKEIFEPSHGLLSGSIPLGLARTKSGGIRLDVGDFEVEQGVYKAGGNAKDSTWWVESKVPTDELIKAVETSIAGSKEKAPVTDSEIELVAQGKQLDALTNIF